MTNKYGWLRYYDTAPYAKKNAQLILNDPMQEGANPSDLLLDSNTIPMYNYASFEDGGYDLRTPPPLYSDEDLVYCTTDVSEADGTFHRPKIIDFTLTGYHSFPGMTIEANVIIKDIEITAYHNSEVIAYGRFSALEKKQFYPLRVERADRVQIVVNAIEEPLSFLSIVSLEFGRINNWGENAIINAEACRYFDVEGDTVRYNTLNATINKEAGVTYAVQQRQKIEHLRGSEVVATYFTSAGVERDNNALQIEAYDFVEQLESDYWGGMFTKQPLMSLLFSITDRKAAFDWTDVIHYGQPVTGYLPVMSRRKALALVLRAAGFRLVRGGGKIKIEKIKTETESKIYDDKNIIVNPKFSTKQPARKLVLKQHFYTKTEDEQEIYRWTIPQGELKRIFTTAPMWDYVAYEVIGQNENGTDMMAETPSANVTFVTKEANYCEVRVTTDRKVVIFGKLWSDTMVDIVRESERAVNEDVNAVEIDDQTVVSCLTVDGVIVPQWEALADDLFELYKRGSEANFLTLEEPMLGSRYEVNGIGMNITAIKDTLNGVYEVEGNG